VTADEWFAAVRGERLSVVGRWVVRGGARHGGADTRRLMDV
jgi:hypothetical protein